MSTLDNTKEREKKYMLEAPIITVVQIGRSTPRREKRPDSEQPYHILLQIYPFQPDKGKRA